MPGRNTNPNLTRQIELAARWRDSGQRGRLYWKAGGNWRWQNWQVNEIARVVDDGQLVQRFYSLDEIADYLDGASGNTREVNYATNEHEKRGCTRRNR